jgi:hypothetical protein
MGIGIESTINDSDEIIFAFLKGRFPMGDVWYYAQDGNSIGPFTLKQLKAVLSEFSGLKDILVWRDGLPNWVLAETVPELAPHATDVIPLRFAHLSSVRNTVIPVGDRSRWAVSVYVVGFVILGSLVARNDPSISAAFL